MFGVPAAYLDYDAALAHFEAHGFFGARPLLVGTFEEAIAFDYNFDTTIPGRLGEWPGMQGGGHMPMSVFLSRPTRAPCSRDSHCRPLWKGAAQ
jgi:hypothetical protein